MDCRVWVATQWLINCSDTLEKEMKSPNEDLTERQAINRGTGKLCVDSNIMPRSVQRWEFWKKRLAEIAEGADGDLGLEEETKKRVEEALKVLGRYSMSV